MNEARKVLTNEELERSFLLTLKDDSGPFQLAHQAKARSAIKELGKEFGLRGSKNTLLCALAAVPKVLNEDVLCHYYPEIDAPFAKKILALLLSRQLGHFEAPGVFRLESDIREHLLNSVLTARPREVRKVHERLANYYERASAADEISLDTLLQYCYHLYCVFPARAAGLVIHSCEQLLDDGLIDEALSLIDVTREAQAQLEVDNPWVQMQLKLLGARLQIAIGNWREAERLLHVLVTSSRIDQGLTFEAAKWLPYVLLRLGRAKDAKHALTALYGITKANSDLKLSSDEQWKCLYWGGRIALIGAESGTSDYLLAAKAFSDAQIFAKSKGLFIEESKSFRRKCEALRRGRAISHLDLAGLEEYSRSLEAWRAAFDFSSSNERAGDENESTTDVNIKAAREATEEIGSIKRELAELYLVFGMPERSRTAYLDAIGAFEGIGRIALVNGCRARLKDESLEFQM